MIEQVESRQFLSATAVLSDGELRIEVSSSVNAAVDVTYVNSRISVQVQDEAASRRIYYGLRRAITSIRVVGSSAADRITLGEGIRSTTVESGGGKDVIVGNSSANVIYGGDGNDSIVGSGGHDVIYGEGGRDTIYGGEGDDRIYGGSDIDHLFGDAGNDRLDGGASKHADYFDGGPGADVMFSSDERDRLNIDRDDRYTDPDINDEPNLTPARG